MDIIFFGGAGQNRNINSLIHVIQFNHSNNHYNKYQNLKTTENEAQPINTVKRW